MDLSIVIVNYNSAVVLSPCLNSIYGREANTDFEVFVVDNNSNDNSAELVEREFPQVKIIKNKLNLGFSKGCNQGIQKSKGGYILLLNPDTIIKSHALEDMVGFMKREPDCGIVGPQIMDSDGTIQLSCRSFPSFRNALFNRYSLFTRLFPNNRFSRGYLLSDWDHNQIREVDWVSGACMMVRRQALDNIGLLDERFFMYCEDVDLCYRMKEQGWKVYYLPEVRITHCIGESSQSIGCRSIIEHHKSMFQFYKKHYKRNFFLDYITLGGIIVRAGLLLAARFVRRKREA
ncbi:glycosyltransferase family 2 protein [bacterium]|nr:glycosyltransferase family 2 protein [bacterium]